MTDDFYRNCLNQMIDLRHPMAVLSNRMPWQEIEASLAQRWARQLKAGKKIENLDLFGPVDLPPPSRPKVMAVSPQILENCGYEDHTIYR